MPICRTGTFDHGYLIFVHKTDNFGFPHIDQRPDHGQTGFIQMRYRRKGMQSALVEEGEQHGLYYIIFVMCIGNLIAPQLLNRIVHLYAFSHKENRDCPPCGLQIRFGQ